MPGFRYPEDFGHGQANFVEPLAYSEMVTMKLCEIHPEHLERSLKIRDTNDRHKYHQTGGEGETIYWFQEMDAPFATEVNSFPHNMGIQLRVVDGNVTQDLMIPAVEWRRRINAMQGTRSRSLRIPRKNASAMYEPMQRKQHKNL